MNSEEISTLLRRAAAELGIILTEEHLHIFGLYLQELREWGEHINLIRRADDREIILKDFIDSLTILKYLPPGSSLADLGSGAGFPGVPVKIVRPDLRVFLLETIQKKVLFLKNLLRVLSLSAIEIHRPGNQRETRPQNARGLDFVVSRAFGSLRKFCSTGKPLLRSGGTLLAMKGRKGKAELEESLSFLEEMGFQPAFVDEIQLPVLGHMRTLIGLKKKEAL